MPLMLPLLWKFGKRLILHRFPCSSLILLVFIIVAFNGLLLVHPGHSAGRLHLENLFLSRCNDWKRRRIFTLHPIYYVKKRYHFANMLRGSGFCYTFAPAKWWRPFFLGLHFTGLPHAREAPFSYSLVCSCLLSLSYFSIKWFITLFSISLFVAYH